MNAIAASAASVDGVYRGTTLSAMERVLVGWRDIYSVAARAR